MTANLQDLAPAENITPEIIDSAISSWKQQIQNKEFVYIDFGKKVQQGAKSNLLLGFVYTLFSTPNFLQLITNMQSFTSAEDLQFGPELCGQDIFDKYLHDTNYASRFFWQIKQFENGEKPKIAQCLENLVQEDIKNQQISYFLHSMVQFIDNAYGWPYLPLPKKVPPFLFPNPLRQLFCSRRLNGIEPFLHIYTVTPEKSLQELIIESGPLLDAPKAICFTCDESNTISTNQLISTLGLPLAVSKDVFEQTCERCYAWEKSAVKQESKDKVIKAYHEAINMATYYLTGYVVVDAENCYVALRENNKNLQASTKPQNMNILSAIYSIVE